MATYLVNSLAPGMFPEQDLAIRLRPMAIEAVRDLLAGGFVSAVGHPATAAALSVVLEVQVPEARVAVVMSPGDTLVVAGIVDRATGKPARLPEGVVLDAAALAAFEFRFRVATCAAWGQTEADHRLAAAQGAMAGCGSDLVALAGKIRQGHGELAVQLSDGAYSANLDWAFARVREMGEMLQEPLRAACNRAPGKVQR